MYYNFCKGMKTFDNVCDGQMYKLTMAVNIYWCLFPNQVVTK